MHASLQEASSFTDDNARTPDKTKCHHVKRSDLPFPVPDDILSDILPDIEPVSPSSLYVNIHAQNDRRLRRLIRRYVNQIQYGCTNFYCNVPTCLSYRKRTSKVPLRRYTDLSARTIACQLVEDFGKQAKNPSVGLCPHHPIVPWYEDPNDYNKRRRFDERETTNETLSNNRTGVQKLDASNQKQAIPESAKHGQQPKTNSVSMTTNQPQEFSFEVSSENAAVALKKVNERGISTSSHRSSNLSYIPEKARQKDSTSLTQCLLDLFSLRRLSDVSLFDFAKSTNRLPNLLGESHESSNQFVEKIGDDHIRRVQSEISDYVGVTEQEDKCKANNSCSFALKILRNVTFEHLHHLNYLKAPEYEFAFDSFVQQSIWSCLSNPERLIASTDEWATCPNCQDQQPGSAIGCECLQYSLVYQQRGFREIPAFLPFDQALNALFVAVQQGFVNPPEFDNASTRRVCQNSNGIDYNDQYNSFTSAQTPNEFYENDRDIYLDNSATSVKECSQPIYLSDHQTSKLCLMALLAATSVVVNHEPSHVETPMLAELANFRNSGSMWPNYLLAANVNQLDWSQSKITSDLISMADNLDDWHLNRLISSTMECISHRLALHRARKATKLSKITHQPPENIIDLMLNFLTREVSGSGTTDRSFNMHFPAIIIEFVRTIILKSWDRNDTIRISSSIGGGLQLLTGLFMKHQQLKLEPGQFYMPFIADTFQDTELPIEWLNFRSDNLHRHILSFSFLFEPATLVRYFRAINVDIMRKSHENAAAMEKHVRDCFLANSLTINGKKEILASLRPHMARYFVLTIRRNNVLGDAINQIWRRQRRELMRPLRVRLGKDEGEDGLDHGGVQQEFFRLVFAEALQPDYGMFQIDEKTRMTWFRPGSLEPLYKYEVLGILMSLAVYNAVTLPITFPLAFYRKLLRLKVKKLHHILDGWPDLYTGLQQLLDWNEGDVGDVIARTYEFSYDNFGTTTNIDMQKVVDNDTSQSSQYASRKGKEKAKSTSFELPLDTQYTPPIHLSPPLLPSIVPDLIRTPSIEIKGISTPISMDGDTNNDPALVTNENREQYVKDYVSWLTDKSIRPQYEAFAKGFYTCLDQTALSLFTPEALRNVMEGHREIDIDELERTATYDEYERQSQTIVTFWDIVRSFDPAQHRKLLEFVTASDRIPVNGIRSIQFLIQRNGDDDNRLPSSSTCYGRLLLPQYSSKAIMEEKLTKAIENSIGFGAL